MRNGGFALPTIGLGNQGRKCFIEGLPHSILLRRLYLFRHHNGSQPSGQFAPAKLFRDLVRSSFKHLGLYHLLHLRFPHDSIIT